MNRDVGKMDLRKVMLMKGTTEAHGGIFESPGGVGYKPKSFAHGMGMSDSPIAGSPGGDSIDDWLADKSPSSEDHGSFAADFGMADSLQTDNQVPFSLSLPSTPASGRPAANSDFSLGIPTTPAVPAALRISAYIPPEDDGRGSGSGGGNGNGNSSDDMIGDVMAETPIPAALAHSFSAFNVARRSQSKPSNTSSISGSRGAAGTAAVHHTPYGNEMQGMFATPGSASSFMGNEIVARNSVTPGAAIPASLVLPGSLPGSPAAAAAAAATAPPASPSQHNKSSDLLHALFGEEDDAAATPPAAPAVAAAVATGPGVSTPSSVSPRTMIAQHSRSTTPAVNSNVNGNGNGNADQAAVLPFLSADALAGWAENVPLQNGHPRKQPGWRKDVHTNINNVFMSPQAPRLDSNTPDMMQKYDPWENEANPALGSVVNPDADGELALAHVAAKVQETFEKPDHDNIQTLGNMAQRLAQKFEEAQEEIAKKEKQVAMMQTNELDLAGTEMAEMEEKVDELDIQLDEATEENERVTDQLAESMVKIEKLQNELSKRDETLAMAASAGAETSEGAAMAAGALRERIANLTAENQRQAGMIAELHDAVRDRASLAERCKSLSSSVQALETQAASSEEERNNLRQTTAEATLLLAEMKNEREAEKIAAIEAAALASGATDSMQKADQNTLEQLMQELASAKKDAEEQRATVAALMADRDLVSAERESALNTSGIHMQTLQEHASAAKQELLLVVEQRENAERSLAKATAVWQIERASLVPKDELEDAATKVEELVQELEERTATHELEAIELKEELAMLKAELATVSSQMEDTAVTVAAGTKVAEQLAESKAAIATLEAEHEELKAEATRCKVDADEANELLAESSAAAGVEVDRAREQIVLLTRERETAETDLVSARALSNTLQDTVGQLTMEVQLFQEIAAEHEKNQQQQKEAAAQSANGADVGVDAGDDPVVAALKEELKMVQEQVEALEAEVSFAAVEKSNAVNKIKRELTIMQEEFEDLESEKDEVQSACEIQQQKLTDLEQELIAARTAFTEAKSAAAAAPAASAGTPATMATLLAEGTRMLISMKSSAEFGITGSGEYLAFARGTAIVVSGEPDSEGNFQAVLDGLQGKVPAACLMDAMDLLDQLTQENTKLQTSAAHADGLREELAQSAAQSTESIQQLEKKIRVADAETKRLRERSEQAAATLAQVESELEAERNTKALLQFGNTEHAAKVSALGERCAELESRLKTASAAAAHADTLLEEAKASRKVAEARDWQAMANLSGVVKETQGTLEELKAERQVHITMIQQHSEAIKAFELMVATQQRPHAALVASASAAGARVADGRDVGTPFAAEMEMLRGFLDDFKSNVETLKDKVVSVGGADTGSSVGGSIGGSAHSHNLTLESELSRVNRMLVAEQVQSEALAGELHSLRQSGGTSNTAAAARPSTKKSVSQRRLIREASKAHEKQLRAESFRKALVYQKKFLLLTIGKFVTAEDVTLAEISRSGVSKFADRSGGAGSRFRFRSVATAIIAAKRMKTLANRWSGLAR